MWSITRVTVVRSAQRMIELLSQLLQLQYIDIYTSREYVRGIYLIAPPQPAYSIVQVTDWSRAPDRRPPPHG